MSKPIEWVGSAKHAVSAFPLEVRRDAGFELRRVQEGLDPTDFRSMVGIGHGVREIRLHSQLEHRVIYLAKFAEAVYVLHAFEKKTRATALRDTAVARSRYRDVLRDRRLRGS